MNGVGSSGGVQHVLALKHEIMQRNEALQQLRQADSAAAPLAPTALAAPTAPANTPDFAGTLTNAVQSVNAAQQRSSDMAAAYERGEVTDVAQVMLARQESGVAFEATLQVRNKLLTAYQEIMRMGA